MLIGLVVGGWLFSRRGWLSVWAGFWTVAALQVADARVGGKIGLWAADWTTRVFFGG